ncbi:hypothetical protein [Methylomarinum vadi]|uniref:hypothetical protein n=1 Tax=Methylomarinum vadi TaxID=438855 RepID=UPI001364193A|nr:hypothetical protein [Methylomarinum vadi]
MSETQEKDRSILYIALTAIIAVSVIIAVKKNENDKYAPIKEQQTKQPPAQAGGFQ